jgi:hypothetical protein
MITPPCGAERHQLIKWSTPRLLRYLKVRRKSLVILVASYCPCFPGCSCGPMRIGGQGLDTIAAMDAEIEFIKEILKTREHVA